MTDAIKKFENLIEFGKLINSSHDFRAFKKKSVTKIKEFMKCKQAKLYRFDDKTNSLISFDNNGDEFAIPVSENTMVGSCAHYMATLYVRECDKELNYKREAKLNEELDAREALMVPLITCGELFGVIQVVDSFDGSFSEEDTRFLENIANILTIALQKIVLFEKLNNQFFQVCEALADAIGKKDKYTGGHTKRVSFFSEMIGKEMGLDFKEMNELKMAAALHDIGKIGIEDKILKKDKPLTDEEFEEMKNHPMYGYEILKKVEGLESVVDGMRFHHERPDGKGYPFGLRGEEIPVNARIISVADTFDAMISTRPYRKGLPPMIAFEEIMNNGGTQFCVKVVEAFARGFKKTNMYKANSVKKAS